MASAAVLQNLNFIVGIQLNLQAGIQKSYLMILSALSAPDFYTGGLAFIA